MDMKVIELLKKIVSLLLHGQTLVQQQSRSKRICAENRKDENLTVRLDEYLSQTFEFRFNQLTDGNEFRSKRDGDGAFAPLNQRAMNTLCMEAHKVGINCWDRDLARYVNSMSIRGYHPFREYLHSLPGWDGTDHITGLARRVSANPLWVKCFHIWMLGVVSQWRGWNRNYANSIAPILVSSGQGRGKSTFCKSLLPPALEDYYIDRIELSSQGQLERKLSETGIINLDEFDKFSERQMALLKNVMQMTSMHYRLPHQKNFVTLPRMASFIGTSNRRDLLTDRTGSRRFICIEVDGKIDCAQINHAQVYAQLMAELDAGRRHWLTEEEESELQAHNKLFYRASPVEDVLLSCFRPAAAGEACMLLSAAEIFKILKEKNSAAMLGANPNGLGYLLATAGMERKHTRKGNVYRVVEEKIAG